MEHLPKQLKFFTSQNEEIGELRSTDIFVLLENSAFLGIYTPTTTDLSPYATIRELIVSGNIQIISKIIEYDYDALNAHLEIDFGYDPSTTTP